MSVIDVDEKSFEKEVLKSEVPVVVDVWAEWCGPCRFFSPIIDETSKDYDNKVKFVKLNADYNASIAAKYNIMAIPTTLLIKNGALKAMNVGAVPKETLKRWIDSNLK
ncbi:MAG: thioredoxin [Candidatus Micrarchaeia archaeon]